MKASDNPHSGYDDYDDDDDCNIFRRVAQFKSRK